jgi:hypothetical protein
MICWKMIHVLTLGRDPLFAKIGKSSNFTRCEQITEGFEAVAATSRFKDQKN